MKKHGPLVKWPKTPASHAGNRGSNPLRVTIVGVNDDEVPPVPIPNTTVKLISAEDTWMETSRENRSVPTLLAEAAMSRQIFLNSSVGRACGC